MSGAFDGLPPQPEATRLLESALAQPGHAYLLSGPRGAGKRRYAERFAAALLASRSSRIESRAHPDLFVLEAEGGSILIERARELRRDLHMRPFEGDRRVYLILDAHLLRDDSANALLKSLEEPPAYAVFVLVSDNAEQMLATIRSRVVSVPFRRLATAELAAHTGDPVAARAALGDLERAERLARDPAAAERRRGYLALARACRLDPGFDGAAAAKTIVDAAAERSAEAQKQVEREGAALLEGRGRQAGAQGAREADRGARQAHRPPRPAGGGAGGRGRGRALVPRPDGAGPWRSTGGDKLGSGRRARHGCPGPIARRCSPSGLHRL